MRERVREAPFTQKRDELDDRRPARLQVGVIFFGEVPDEHVQRHVVLLEPRGHLNGQKGVGQVRNAKRALERVVVADRDELHAALLANAVDTLRVGVRLTKPRAA